MERAQVDVIYRKMSRCIELAREAAASGNYALGALVLLEGDVIGESASNLITDDTDPSAHPEMVAVRAAAHRLRSRYLPGAILVSTLEPCPMCMSVAIWAKMEVVAFGASQSDAVAWARDHPSDIYTWRQIGISAQDLALAGEPKVQVYGGVRREECVDLFRLSGTFTGST